MSDAPVMRARPRLRPPTWTYARFVLAFALPRLHAALFALVVASSALWSSGALAQRPTSKTTGYSAYEKETIRRALAASKLTLDPAPEGKIIDHIDTMRFDVFEDRDPIPEKFIGIPARKILNSLHYTSRDYVIRREMLIHEGEEYVQVLVDETARNMRARMPLQVSVVVIVPIKTEDPDKVSILIITKDVWSLRLSFDFSATPGGLENFLLVPQETNLFGRHHTVSTRFQYQPESYTIGGGYNIPRFGLSWIGASLAGNVIINRRSGDAEGVSVSASAGQDLYSTRATWAWGVSGGYTNLISRRYSNARVATFDSKTTDERDGIPAEYRSRAYTASVFVTRSFGWAVKNNFSLSLVGRGSSYDPGDLSRFNPAAAADFVQRLVPVGETRVYPMLSWATFKNDFLRTIDIATLALQEDYRLGHDVSLSIYPIFRALGSTRDVLGVSGKAGYAVAMGDGMAGASVSAFSETEDGTTTDGSYSATFGAATPRFKVGRIVMNASILNRYRNYLRSRSFTGGDDRLRGYPSNFFFGKDTLFYNIEFRSTSIDILSCQVGGVLFYDAGDAVDGFSALRAKQSTGFGIRALFPQLNRMVFRADLAFPLQRGPFPETGVDTRVDPVGFYFAFNQAFAP